MNVRNARKCTEAKRQGRERTYRIGDRRRLIVQKFNQQFTKLIANAFLHFAWNILCHTKIVGAIGPLP
jgi:hypothetical protein